jgi:hypothetical protein
MPNVSDGGIGLALLYPAREWSVRTPGHRGYPRASDLILGNSLRFNIKGALYQGVKSEEIIEVLIRLSSISSRAECICGCDQNV